jgi:hypothetical protein
VSIWCVGGWEYAEEEEEEKKIEGKKKRWSGWIFLPGKAAHMECSQPATLCCYCCCFSFFGVVAMSGFFSFSFFLPLDTRRAARFPPSSSLVMALPLLLSPQFVRPPR